MNEKEYVESLLRGITSIKDKEGNEMDLKDIQKVQWNTAPTPVEIVGTTFGNEIQTKILTQLRVANLLLFYLGAFATARYFLVGN